MTGHAMTARDWIAHMRSILDGNRDAPPGQQALDVPVEEPRRPYQPDPDEEKF
jgi:hypothetical protein